MDYAQKIKIYPMLHSSGSGGGGSCGDDMYAHLNIFRMFSKCVPYLNRRGKLGQTNIFVSQSTFGSIFSFSLHVSYFSLCFTHNIHIYDTLGPFLSHLTEHF